MHSNATRVLTALVAGGVLVGGSGIAYADTLQDTIADTGTGVSLVAGSGTSASAAIRVVGNNAQGDPDPGCNIDPGEAALVLNIITPAGVTANPDPLSLNSCGTDFTVTFTATSTAVSGRATVSVMSGPAGDGTYKNEVDIPITVTKPAAPADSTAPTSSASATAGGAGYTSGTWTNESVAVSLTGTDNTGGSGLKEIRYTTDGTAPTATSAKYTAPLSYAADGTTTIKYAAVDNADNVGTVNTFVVRVDKTAPAVTPADVNDTTWRSDSLTQAFTSTDGGSGLAVAADASFSLTATTAQPTASKTVADAAGNSTTRTVSARVDGTAPTSSAIATAAVSASETADYSSGDWTNKTVSVALSGADTDGSGLKEIRYTTDGTAPTATSAKYTAPLSYAADGTTTIKYAAVDNADNVGTANTFVVQVDKTAPVISGTDVNNTTWRNTPLAGTFTASDASGSGLATPSDASFTLTASAQSASATSPTVDRKTVTDQAGNAASRSVSALIDTTAPVISGEDVLDTTWRNSSLSQDFTASDALSGLADTDKAFTLTASDESADANTATTDSKTITDAAGNVAVRTLSAKIDKTAPVVSGEDVLDTTWRNSSLSQDFTASDALSGLADTDKAFTLTASDESADANTATTDSKTITDAAGNVAVRTLSAKIDKTAPVIIGGDVLDTAWRADSLSQNFTASDALSGIDEADKAFTLTASDESADANTPTTDSKTITDAAGNVAVRTLSAKIDKTAPVVSGADVENTTWRNTDLTASFTASDRLSGLATAADAAFSLTASDESVDASTPTTASKTVTDAVGNSTTRTVSAKIDRTAPAISGANANVTTWSNGPVSRNFTASDALSGLQASTDATFALTATAESANASTPTTVSKTVLDNAGNISARTLSALIDLTQPVISGQNQVDSTWRNTPLSGTFTASDALSDLQDPADASFALTATADSANADAPTVVTRTVKDNAGNAQTRSLSARIDTVAPTGVSFLNGPTGGTRYYTNTVPTAPTCTATDGLSGLATCTVTGYSAAEGTHTLTATATDKAGNSTTATRTYTVKNLNRSGFFSPVDMNGVWNTIKGGNTVPLKFEVFDGQTELKTTAAIGATFTAAKVTCVTGGEDVIETFTTTGQTELRFDASGDQFIQNWKTPTGSGCYKATLTTADGQIIMALFKTLK